MARIDGGDRSRSNGRERTAIPSAVPARPVPRRSRPAARPSPARRSRQRPAPTSLRWAIRNHRLVLCGIFGIAGALVLISAVVAAGTAETVQEQLRHATVAFVGVFLLGVAILALWGDQRRREMVRLSDVELYVSALAAALGLVDENRQGGAARGDASGNGARARSGAAPGRARDGRRTSGRGPS